MGTLGTGAIVFLCVFGGALGGMLLRALLPRHHLAKETEDAVKLGMGVIATMAALVIGLLIASAKSARDTKDDEIARFSANLVLLDRNLAHYGPETKDACDVLRRYVVYKIDKTWPAEASHPVADTDGWMLLEDVQDDVRALVPRNDAQRWIQARALQISGDISQALWLLRSQTQDAIPGPFLFILVFWLTILFASFGVFAPRNGTMVAALLVAALSITGAVFLIVDMSQPFSGVVHLSSTPMRDALAMLGR